MQFQATFALTLLSFLVGANASSYDNGNTDPVTPQRSTLAVTMNSPSRQRVVSSTYASPLSWSRSPPPRYHTYEDGDDSFSPGEGQYGVKTPNAPRPERIQKPSSSLLRAMQGKSTPTRATRRESLMSRMTLGKGPVTPFSAEDRSPSSPIEEDEDDEEFNKKRLFETTPGRLLHSYRSPLLNLQSETEAMPSYAESMNSRYFADFDEDEIISDDMYSSSMQSQTDPTTYSDMNSMMSCSEGSSAGGSVSRAPQDAFGPRMTVKKNSNMEE